MLRILKKIIPAPLFTFIAPFYHFLLAFLGALICRFPSKKIIVIGVTGTKGKTSTTELLNAILEEAGFKTAVLGTLRFKTGERSERNLRKMSMPGRFFVQKFLRDAVKAGCTHAIIEMTSEGAKQFRQRFIDMDALIFTNLAPEHIESHGSYEKYRDAKLSIAHTLARSSKSYKFMVANADDAEGEKFLNIPGLTPIPFRESDGAPIDINRGKTSLTLFGEQIVSSLPGIFNAHNIIAAATCAHVLGVDPDVISRGVARVSRIEGRAERIDEGQGFPVIVDYAHTPDSLEAIYDAFKDYQRICVLGNTGGGRDKWKRPVMGEIADKHCAHIILTNEDPYDEDPMAILQEIKEGITKTSYDIILDRRGGIAGALAHAQDTKNAAVLITGKGTDPYIMGPNGSKIPWDDRDVAREEIKKLLATDNSSTRQKDERRQSQKRQIRSKTP